MSDPLGDELRKLGTDIPVVMVSGQPILHRFDFEDGRHTICGLYITTSNMRSCTTQPSAVTCLACMEDWQLEDGAWVNSGTDLGTEYEAEIQRRSK